jgi:hypothetical protein
MGEGVGDFDEPGGTAGRDGAAGACGLGGFGETACAATGLGGGAGSGELADFGAPAAA